jgi:2-polyprenyl-6-methoxyphenol hydroxylase-like FAD-dependent oxidoreductase
MVAKTATHGVGPTPARKQRRALIIGGSLGGLFAANLLRVSGWHVDVYERARGDLSSRGTGIVTHPQLLEILNEAGAESGAAIGIAVQSRVTLGRDGEVVGKWPLPQIVTGWSHLWRHLKDVFPVERYHAGKTLVEIEQDEHGVIAHFADGSAEQGELLIGADGFRSTVRQLFWPDIEPIYAGYVAWRGLVDESVLSDAAHRALFDNFVFCLPPHEQILGYPVAGQGNTIERGHRRFNFVWYRPADAERKLPALLTDSAGRLHRDGIPPTMVNQNLLDGLRADAARLLSPQFEEVVRLSEQPFFQPIYDLESSAMASGRVIVIGDAAFVVRPHCGIGVTKAAEDARCLAWALRDEDRPIYQALAEVSSKRMAFGQVMVSRARHLGAYMQAQIKTAEERQMAERYRTAEAVMRETAISPELIPERYSVGENAT